MDWRIIVFFQVICKSTSQTLLCTQILRRDLVHVVSDSGDLVRGLRFPIFSTLAGDVDAAGL